MIHGDCDNDVHYVNAVRAQEGIKDSILLTLKHGTHSVWYHEDFPVYMEQQMAFAKKHCGMEYDQAALDRKFDYVTDIDAPQNKLPKKNE